MQINASSFLHGQTGLQNSQNKLDQASRKIADASTQTIGQQQSIEKSNSGSEIQDGLIEANSSKLEAQANAKVIDAANKSIGRLIDIKA
ncbi:hypothetical protein [Marinomonas transparens]|uniref:Uncharacterized protein n=1 Tax=Marinomonas transparens TaxID=2795388 RepID=A0A934JNE3_9GAMM|nr:hypothetical protein [Marinomonas transparens]MBJ7536718.1 hypothetical protein [Marinomonas transparens]